MQGNAGHPLKIASAFFVACFCKVSAGCENDTYEDVSQHHPDAEFFKALGQYDIVAFAPDSGTDLPTSSSHITSCIHLPLVSLACGSYTSPNLPTWLRRAPVAAFVLLELDKFPYFPYKESKLTLSISQAISKIIAHFQSSSRWSTENLAFFAGIGQSELIAVVHADNFEDIFGFVSYCRGLTFGALLGCDAAGNVNSSRVFSSTHTTPLISYKQVINAVGGFERIRGEVSAHVFVDCPTGLEADIQDSQFFSGARMQSVLGTPDVLINVGSILGGDLIRNLLEFRKCQSLIPQVTSTTTFLSFDFRFPKEVPCGRKKLNIAAYPTLSKCCPGFDVTESELAARIRAISHGIWSKLIFSSSYPLVARIGNVPIILQSEAAKLQENCGENGDSASQFRGTLINLLEKAEIGFE